MKWTAEDLASFKEAEQLDTLVGTNHYTPDESDTQPSEAVRFVSPAELAESVPPEPDWVWESFIARGAVTILGGKPKAGKSTLALKLADKASSGASAFLTHAISGGPVLYVSEEGAGTLAHKTGTGDIRFATRETAWPKPLWPELIAAAVAEARRVNAVLLVIDTFAAWAGLGPESEKDAGTVQMAMEPLVEAAKAGLAVLLVVHARKGGGEDGEGIRGSSALAGAADIILELDRVSGGQPRQRKLLALSRFPQTPGVAVIEQNAESGEWSVIGEGADRGDAREISDRASLLTVLDAEEPLSRAELQEAMGSPEQQWHDTLKALLSAGEVVRSGEGKKGDPYRYRKVRTDAAQTPAQNRRSNTREAVLDAAAHPVGVQHQKQAAAESISTDGCAESGALDADAELQRLEAKFGSEAVG